MKERLAGRIENHAIVAAEPEIFLLVE